MKKWELSRRTLLRGAGTAMALPVLEQMLPAIARAQTPTPKRLVAFYIPNGIYMAKWTPAAVGAGYVTTPILKALEEPYVDGAFQANISVKNDVLVLSGLQNAPARPDGPGDHASGTGAFITCSHPFKTSGADIRNGISMDQVAANALRGQTRFASLELGNDGGNATGDCDSGYSCAYARNISWSGPSTPVPKETNPRAAFDRLFAGMSTTETRAEVQKRMARKQSVLDAVKANTQSLRARLGRTDTQKLDEYFTSVRELERRVAAMDDSLPACTPGTAPTVTGDVRGRTRAMMDILALAFQCDVTRVATFMLGNAGSNYVYSFLGLTGGHHGDYSHHQNDPAKLSALEKIDYCEVQQFAYLVQKLKNTQDVDGGTVLDNSALFFSSEIEDGNTHSHNNMPVLVAGRGAGTLNPGRHLRFTGVPVANLLLTLLKNAGVGATSFGDSTGVLSGL